MILLPVVSSDFVVSLSLRFPSSSFKAEIFCLVGALVESFGSELCVSMRVALSVARFFICAWSDMIGDKAF